jgi:branched-chain amino acid aminotransferase
VGLLNGWGVFSTIRVADGVLFAFERHWARMEKDARLMHVPMPADADAARRDLLALVEANAAFNATLRVAIVRNRGGFFEGEGIQRDFDMIAFTTDLHDWGKGAKLSVQEHARHGASPFAGTKVLSWSQNLTMLESAKAAGFDEVILLDENGRVSECTSANIFACGADGVVRTPPLDAGCLPGITRQVVLELAGTAGVRVEEAHVRLADLFGADSVFITSTTRELLPVSHIRSETMRKNDAPRAALHGAYAAYMERYVAEKQRDGLAARHPVRS